MSKLVISALVAAALSACAGGGYEVSAGYATGGPNLVQVSPGVWAVADAELPVFYAGNSYWLYRGGAWYRSPYWTGGWHYAPQVPYAVRTIRNPYYYSHGRIRVQRGPTYRGHYYYDRDGHRRYNYDRNYNYNRRYRTGHDGVQVVRPPHPIGRCATPVRPRRPPARADRARLRRVRTLAGVQRFVLGRILVEARPLLFGRACTNGSSPC
jgi:hypothetical protein